MSHEAGRGEGRRGGPVSPGGGGPSGPPVNPRELTPQRARILAVAVLVLAALTVWRLVVAPVPGGNEIAEFSGAALGTTYLVKVDHDLDDQARQGVRRAIEDALARVDSLMSTWRDDSQLTALNEAPADSLFVVAPETFAVLSLSQEVSGATAGAFDVTVGPLVAVWGFGADGGAPEPPEPAELAAARARVDWSAIRLDQAASGVVKAREGLRIDLSAVAKGYAVDAVAEAIEGLGWTRHLVEVGGELRAGAPKADGSPWRIAIETPDARTRSIYGVLELTDEAVATSGDYRDFYEVDGVRYAHIIDPRTGRPVSHSGASVTVIASDAATADAWATALSVLGPDEGPQVAESRGMTAFFIYHAGDGFESRATSAMAERVDLEPSRN